MSYAFDNSPLSTLFRNYYPARFPTLWRRFDTLVTDGEILSTREVRHEIDDGAVEVDLPPSASSRPHPQGPPNSCASSW